jgi:hypothetical protein
MAWYAAVARWAPSKHNTQPWRFVIRDESLEFWTDPTRTLTATDGHQREMFIACGAAIHLAVLAAHAAGHQVRVHVLPDGDDGPAARIRETGSHSATMDDLDLFGAIARRRTDRGPLDADALPADLPFTLQAAAAAYAASFRMATTPGDRATLADLVQRADRLLLQRGLVDRELAPWLHSPEVARRDGVPTDHTRGAAASVRAEFVQRDFSTANSRPAQDRVGPDRPLVGVLCTPTDRVSDWLATGQALASLLLRATLAGANSSFLNQPVEEAAIRSQLRDQLSLTGVAQLVLRLGVGGEVLPTPRRYLRDVIHHA